MRAFANRWRRVRSLPGLSQNLAIVTVLLVSAVVVGTGLLARQRFVWPWEQRVSYQAEFLQAPSVAPGRNQEVRIAGVRVGDITKAEVTKDGHARLTLRLDPRYGKVYDNARAALRPKTPLMDMYVLLDPGGPPGRLLRPGTTIPVAQTVPPVVVDEVLAHLDARARGALRMLLTEMDAALARPHALPGALRAGADTLNSLRPVVAALETRRDRIASLVTALADISTAAGADDARLARLLADARSSLEVLANRDSELDATLARLPGVTDGLGRAAGQVQTLSAELDPALDGLRAAAGQLPPALSAVRGLVNRLDGTLDHLAPVVSGARPLVSDLRPLVGAVRGALVDTASWTPRLDPMTANLVRYLPSVQQAVYQINSGASVQDAPGPFLRAEIVGGPETPPRPQPESGR